MLVYGVNPVLEALRTGRVKVVRVGGRTDARIADVLTVAARQHVKIDRVSAADLDRQTRGGVHQGVLAELDAADAYTPADLVSLSSGPPLLVVLDGIEDPQNFGAILRTVDAAGAAGVVRQSRHAAPLGGATAKASAGAVSHVRIAEVVNIARAIEELKASGVWTVGLAADAGQHYDQIDFTVPTALVVGAEGSGLRRLVRERCDWVASIPMGGRVSSLNVSVATGIVLFEAVRQRRAAGRDRSGKTP